MANNMILLMDDDENICKVISLYLEKEGMNVQVAHDGATGMEMFRSESPNLVLLDIMMPGMDGIDLIKKLRVNGITTPALFLSARTEVHQRIEGLDAGADDYLPKPFATQELLARVRAMLRRKDNFTPDLLTVGTLTLNRSTFELQCGSRIQPLSSKEFQVMEMLMRHPGQILTAEQLITHIWGWDSNVDTSVVWVHISNIRKKIDALGATVIIKFVRNAGYVLEASV